MTCSCGNPNCSGAPDHERTAQIIAAHGQSLVAVMGSEDEQPFVYTIGRTERGEPELLMPVDHDSEFEIAADSLNFLGPRDVQAGHHVRCDGLQRVYCVIRPDDDFAAILHETKVVQADNYYGRPVDVLLLEPVPLRSKELH